jgi:hypothetical protein
MDAGFVVICVSVLAFVSLVGAECYYYHEKDYHKL